jgi:hypothetical protein
LESRRLMMNKSLRLCGRESSRNRIYGFQRGDGTGESQNPESRKKKSRRFRRL